MLQRPKCLALEKQVLVLRMPDKTVAPVESFGPSVMAMYHQVEVACLPLLFGAVRNLL